MDIHVTRLSTAMTNQVFVIENQVSILPQKFLLRIYGESCWIFERSIEECTMMVLSRAGLIPTVLGIFGNGRIEEFIPSNSLSSQEYLTGKTPEVIIKRLASIHRLLPQMLMSCSWKEEDYARERFDHWRSMARNIFTDLATRDHDKMDQEVLNSIHGWGVFNDQIIDVIRDRAFSIESPLVFSHCDVRQCY